MISQRRRRLYGQRLTEAQKLERLVLRRRQQADYKAKRRAMRYKTVVADISRDEIIERDGKVCYLCGRELSIHEVTIDHVTPLIFGGSHTPDNIRIAHRSCNSKKGTRLIDFV